MTVTRKRRENTKKELCVYWFCRLWFLWIVLFLLWMCYWGWVAMQ
jgi:hypothetical protein